VSELLSAQEFFDRKRDFSPFLVHLTKDETDNADNNIVITPAKDILEIILSQRALKAFNCYCLFNTDLEKPESNSFRDSFKVVCFTETPIDQIHILLSEVQGKKFKPKPYGLVFKKDYIRMQEGNPVFYVYTNLFDSLWSLYNDAKNRNFSLKDNKVLALVNRCDEKVDFHWEREWRIVGDLHFNLSEIYCGLCPEEDISYFQSKYSPVKFISPQWGLNRILDKLVGKGNPN
jgi:hypothetical protein